MPNTHSHEAANETSGSGDLTAEQARLLAEVGFLAIRRNRVAEARRIFAAVAAFRPLADTVLLGEALLLMTEGRHPEAARLLGDGLAQRLRDEGVHCVHALALMMSGDVVGCIKVLDALPPGRDPCARRLAGEIERELRRRAGPLNVGWNRLHRRSPAETAP